MKLLVVLAACAQVALSGHVAVRMPFLNPAGITYSSYGPQAGHSALDYDYSQQAYAFGEAQAYNGGHQQVAFADSHGYSEPHAAVGFAEQISYHAGAPAAVGYAQVPVKAAVAVPTVHHVPAVADVPVTKYEAQPAVLQKVVDVAKPAIKTRKYEIRRPAIQKQFYDIEERTIVRPVGSALVELDEPLSKAQKGPAIVTSVDDHHHHQVAVAAEHNVAVTAAPFVHGEAYGQAIHTVAITPTPHTLAVSPIAHHGHHEAIAVTPTVHYEEQYYQQAPVHHGHIVSSTPAPVHFSTSEAVLVSSTPVPHYASDDAIVVEAAARNAAVAEHAAYEAKVAHEEAIARAQYNHKNAHLAVEAFSNGSPLEHHEHNIAPAIPAHGVRNLNHLSHEEAQENQQRLLKLLTAKGGVAEVGFGKDGHSEGYVGDAGISRARVLSATPSPHHEPVEEKYKTRRIVVSRPVQTLQEIDVVEPATKIERIAVNQPGYIKTAKVGLERVHTSVPVYGKALAPAIAHAQVPVGYYHK